MAGLKEWFKQDWVDIGAKKKGGGFKKEIVNKKRINKIKIKNKDIIEISTKCCQYKTIQNI